MALRLCQSQRTKCYVCAWSELYLTTSNPSRYSNDIFFEMIWNDESSVVYLFIWLKYLYKCKYYNNDWNKSERKHGIEDFISRCFDFNVVRLNVVEAHIKFFLINNEQQTHRKFSIPKKGKTKKNHSSDTVKSKV